MTNEELDNYMKTVNPNFDSHIEKGTIEMSNEYYNLLEEKMARLINQNQELKEQLEEKEKKYIPGEYATNEFIKEFDENILLKNHQKEFIEYMTKTIEELECEDVDDEEMKGYLIQRIDTFKEIFSKYKEIIGVSDEKK